MSGNREPALREMSHHGRSGYVQAYASFWIRLPDWLASRLHHRVRAEQTTTDDLIARAVATYLDACDKPAITADGEPVITGEVVAGPPALPRGKG